jgi:hypothetical protein
MPDRPFFEKPTEEELAALHDRVTKLLEEMDAVPESERVHLTSGKFAGPVAETVIDPQTGKPSET